MRGRSAPARAGGRRRRPGCGRYRSRGRSSDGRAGRSGARSLRRCSSSRRRPCRCRGGFWVICAVHDGAVAKDARRAERPDQDSSTSFSTRAMAGGSSDSGRGSSITTAGGDGRATRRLPRVAAGGPAFRSRNGLVRRCGGTRAVAAVDRRAHAGAARPTASGGLGVYPEHAADRLGGGPGRGARLGACGRVRGRQRTAAGAEPVRTHRALADARGGARRRGSRARRRLEGRGRLGPAQRLACRARRPADPVDRRRCGGVRCPGSAAGPPL